jgi:hypothetical protein
MTIRRKSSKPSGFLMGGNMKQTSWLKQTLNREKKRLISARQMLKKNPNSYSAKVTTQSAEQRLAELQQLLRVLSKETKSNIPSKLIPSSSVEMSHFCH